MNKIKTILTLFALLLLMTMAGEFLLDILFEGYAGRAHLAVPLFFFLLYAVPLAVVPQPVDAKGFAKQLMVFKSLKLMLSLGAMVAMSLAFREQVTGVLVNFLIYCLVMIVVENIYVIGLKKRITKGT